MRLITLVLLALGVLLAGCSPVAPPPSAATPDAVTPTVAPTPTSAPEAPILELGQTTALGDSGFQIDYPTGWTVRTQGSTTMIEANAGACELHNGYCIAHDHRSLAYMQTLGLPENPTAEDLLALNRTFFDWEELSEPETGEVFGAPALGLRYFDDDVWGYIWTGILDNEAFLINIAGPEEAGLDEILPTFQAMLETIRPVE